MRVGSFLATIVCGWLLGCGGQVLTLGTCEGDPGSGDWFCSPYQASVPRSEPLIGMSLPQCQAGVAAGDSCQTESVNTTNTTLPAMFSGPAPNCFDCSGGGTGTEWTCGSGGWEAAATYSCSQ
jgi:hypothetical protein